MAQVHTSQHFDVGAEELWERIGDFGTLADWHPAIASQTPSEDGRVRTLHLEGGGEVVEELVEETPGRQVYRIRSGVMPVRDYLATLSVEDADGGSVATWQAEFTSHGATEEQAEAAVLGVFRSGLEAL